MTDLTIKQQKILDLIKQFIKDKGYPPTFREISKIYGKTNSTFARSHFVALELKGYIQRDHNVNRGIRVCSEK